MHKSAFLLNVLKQVVWWIFYWASIRDPGIKYPLKDKDGIILETSTEIRSVMQAHWPVSLAREASSMESRYSTFPLCIALQRRFHSTSSGSMRTETVLNSRQATHARPDTLSFSWYD